MKYEMNEEDRDWVEQAINSDYTKLQIKKKLEVAGFNKDKTKAFLEYYESLKNETEEKDKKDEKEFEKSVKEFAKGERGNLSWGERRKIKHFMKGIKKYSQVMKGAIEMVKKEIIFMNEQKWTEGKIEEEMNYLKDELIDRIIDSKGILEIEHPITGEEVTKENLKSLNIDQLTNIMEDNVKTIDEFINGKITE